MLGVNQSGTIAAGAARLISPIVILAAYLLIWRKQLADYAAFCLLLVVMILCSPVAWSHYMVLMVLPAAIFFRTAATIENERLRQLIYIVAGLSLMPDLDGSFFPRNDSAIAWAIHYYPLYALAVSAVLFVRLRELQVGKRTVEGSRSAVARETELSVV